MTINYELRENHLTSDPNDYYAGVQTSGSVDLDAIVQRMIDQGSTVTKADILAVLEDAIKASESYLLDGFRVNFGGFCELFPRIGGVFNGLEDSFDSSRHHIDLGANPGIRVRKTIRQNAEIAKQEATVPKPNPVEYIDLATGEVNDSVTMGNIGTLNGHRLKFNPDQPDEGIFFMDTDSDEEHKVTAVQRNKPSQLVFLVPTLTPELAECKIQVRKRFGDADSELRTGTLDAVLSL